MNSLNGLLGGVHHVCHEGDTTSAFSMGVGVPPRPATMAFQRSLGRERNMCPLKSVGLYALILLQTSRVPLSQAPTMRTPPSLTKRRSAAEGCGSCVGGPVELIHVVGKIGRVEYADVRVEVAEGGKIVMEHIQSADLDHIQHGRRGPDALPGEDL